MIERAWPATLRALGLLSLAALAAGAVPELIAELSTPELPLLWWLGRSSGLLAYLALWLSMLFGTLVSSKGGALLPPRLAFELHQRWALAALLAALLHTLVVVADEAARIPAAAAIVPFASPQLRGAVALGTFALWGLAVIAASSWLRARIPHAAWRAIHALAFGVFVLGLAHGVTAGTDTALPWVRVLYAATIAVLSGALTSRVALALIGRRSAASRRA